MQGPKTTMFTISNSFHLPPTARGTRSIDASEDDEKWSVEARVADCPLIQIKVVLLQSGSRKIHHRSAALQD